MYLGGDWGRIAAFWTRWVDDPQIGPTDLSSLAGPLYAAIAAYAQAEAGASDEARSMLNLLTPVLQHMEPQDANQNGAVGHAAAAVWRLGAAEYAPVYRRLALDLIAEGIGDYPQCSNALTVARMAALIGNREEAASYFDRARRTLHAAEQDPLLAIVDLDEARDAINAGGPPQAAATRLDAALAAFEAIGMPIWANRARDAQGELATKLGTRASFPAGLTEREVDVLRLVARGQSDRQVSETLFISPRTVNAHLRNMLSKTDSANRTELSIWAFEHGLVAHGSPSGT
jgi:DNA-binding CsgD family transcriptional regulator